MLKAEVVERHKGWGAAKVEPWRDAERRLQVTRDTKLPITLPYVSIQHPKPPARLVLVSDEAV